MSYYMSLISDNMDIDKAHIVCYNIKNSKFFVC